MSIIILTNLCLLKQITPDTASEDYNLFNRSGRVLLKKRFQLWEGKNPGRVASFNTSFLINIYRWKNTSAGEGFAFIIAPDLELPANSYGQYLGLTNSSTDGKTTNRIVAVELDTYKDGFDPDDNHVGLDINSVKSRNVASLGPGIVIAPDVKARFYNVWVQYDGVKKVIEVYIAEQLEKLGETPQKPANPVLKSNLELEGVVDQYSYFGFSASTGVNKQFNCVLRCNLTVEHYAKEKDSQLKVIISVTVPIVVLLVLGALILGYYVYKKRKAESNPFILGALRTLPGTPKEFSFKDLKKAANNFDEKNKLGQGRYGVVYKGIVVNEDLDVALNQKKYLEVAVKWFSRESLKGEDDFLAELTIINRLRHKHLVRLLGWSHKKGKLLLVYEYMPNGSLDNHLFSQYDNPPLSWTLRYKIVSNVASALHYLHNEYEQRVVHRDLKASNILLDSEFNARIGDFGLARALESEKTSYAETAGVLGTMGYIAPECFHMGRATEQSDVYAFGAVLLETVSGLRPGSKIGEYQYLVDYIWSMHREGKLLGTMGYIAPECFHMGRATEQSDVYAFGAVLLETVSGLRPGSKIGEYQYLVDYIWSMHREGKLLEAVDKRLGEDYNVTEAWLLLLGLACSNPVASNRPKSQDIIQIISGSVPVPHVQPFRPVFMWPPMPSEDISLETRSFETIDIESGRAPISRDSYSSNSDD